VTPGHLSEVFTSVEGEGIYAGRPASFVRLSGCNLACGYCDTPQARTRQPVFEVRGCGGARRLPNPVSAADLAALFGGLPPAPAVVFTGGEPLLQAPFVADAGGRLRRRGRRIHLETNGTLAEAMAAVREAVDFVSMDVKLPSSQGGADLFEAHRAFLETLGGTRAAIKVVVGAGTAEGEIEAAAALVASVNPQLPMLLQPVFEGERPTVLGEQLAGLLAAARSRLPDVRLSVQMHKVLGMM